MMNRIALASLCLLMSLGIFAQNQSKWKIGFKAGGNYSDQLLSGAPEGGDKLINQSTKWLSGLHAGFRSELLLNESLSLNADLLYNQRGFRSRLTYSSNLDYRFATTSHYLSLPITTGVRLFDQLWIEAGGEFSLRLDQTARIDGEKVDAVDTQFAATDFGLTGGLAYQFGRHIKLSSRYYRGLGNVQDVTFTDANGQPYGNDAKVIYHGVQFSLIVFPF